jgi:hypothetical protein
VEVARRRGGGATSAKIPGLPVNLRDLGQVIKMIKEEVLELLAVDCLEGEVLKVGTHEGFKNIFATHKLQ